MRMLLGLVMVGAIAAPGRADDWLPLFNGKDLTGWRANRKPEAFTVHDGILKANAPDSSSHLFYIGDLKNGAVKFKNFELEAVCRSEPNANSGIFIHTAFDSARGSAHHLFKGYEIQLNSSAKEKRKTGSLYAVVDLATSPVDETQWFTTRIRVDGKVIGVWLNDKQVVDYTEPDDVMRPPDRAGRLLDPQGGAIALHGHDPKSTFYFKTIRLKRLP